MPGMGNWSTKTGDHGDRGASAVHPGTGRRVTREPSPLPIRRVNVLNVVHFPIFGGPHNQALQLAGPLMARGFRTVVVIPNEPGNAAARLRAGGVDVRDVPLGRLRATKDLRRHARMVAGMPAEVRRLRRLIRAERIDIVQIGGFVNPHAAIAARLEHVPVVWQLLDTRAPHLVASAAMVWVRELADVVMSTGSIVAEAHPGYAAIADRVVPFFPPVDLDRFAPHPELRAEIRAEWGVASTGSGRWLRRQHQSAEGDRRPGREPSPPRAPSIRAHGSYWSALST